jgi:hypothetical protein
MAKSRSLSAPTQHTSSAPSPVDIPAANAIANAGHGLPCRCALGAADGTVGGSCASPLDDRSRSITRQRHTTIGVLKRHRAELARRDLGEPPIKLEELRYYT